MMTPYLQQDVNSMGYRLYLVYNYASYMLYYSALYLLNLCGLQLRNMPIHAGLNYDTVSNAWLFDQS